LPYNYGLNFSSEAGPAKPLSTGSNPVGASKTEPRKTASECGFSGFFFFGMELAQIGVYTLFNLFYPMFSCKVRSRLGSKVRSKCGQECGQKMS